MNNMYDDGEEEEKDNFSDDNSSSDDNDDDNDDDEDEEDCNVDSTEGACIVKGKRRRPGRPPLLNANGKRKKRRKRGSTTKDAPSRGKRTNAATRPKRLIMELEPPGPGPWWAFIMVNVDDNGDTKKQAEVRLDTNPRLIEAIKNELDQGDWVIVLRLGPFYSLNFAGLVLSEWSDGTRGPGPRIIQGLCLWHKYRDIGVQGFVISQTKQEVQQIFAERRRALLLCNGHVRIADPQQQQEGDGNERKKERPRVYAGRIPAREIISAPSYNDNVMNGTVAQSLTATGGRARGGRKRVAIKTE